jgi:hypothetical protein
MPTKYPAKLCRAATLERRSVVKSEPHRATDAGNCERVRADALSDVSMLCDISIALAYAISYRGVVPGRINRHGDAEVLTRSGLHGWAKNVAVAVGTFKRNLDRGCFWTATDELGPPSAGSLPSPFASLELVAVPAALAGQTAIALRHTDGTLFQVA